MFLGKMIKYKFFLLVWSSLAYGSTTPIDPSKYYKMIGHGFATNYFKTLKFDRYNDKNIDDVAAAGFTNLRLRCKADLEGLDMAKFLNDLEHVVDKCLSKNVIPIISWIHVHAEAYGTEKHRKDYIKWWKQVATKLRRKDYRLSFNTLTELGTDGCKDCDESLRVNTEKYNRWQKSVIRAIRKTGSKNKKRILIIGAPKKTAKDLDLIDKSIYTKDKYIMVEWHEFANGPNKNIMRHNEDGTPQKYGPVYWKGTGDTIGKQNVDNAIKPAKDWSSSTGVYTYFGAWMAHSMLGEATEIEIINFVRYFIKAVGDIPWSLNVLDRYYDTENSKWITSDQTLRNYNYPLNMSKILDVIKEELNI